MPSTPKPKIVHVPRRLPRPARPPRRNIQWPWVRLAFMAVAGIAVFALTADLASLRIRADKAFRNGEAAALVSDAVIEIATATNRYLDFAGRFSIPLPPSWAAYPFRNEGDYDVTLRGPHQMEISIMTRPAGPGGMAAVRATIVENETRARIRTDLEETAFQGRPAIRRVVPLRTITVEALDFLVGPLHVHIAASAPRNAFDDLRPALHEIRERIEFTENGTRKTEE